jgi:putative membrane protein
VFAGAGSMVAAALVLLLSAPTKRRAALTQMTPGLLAVIALAVGLSL